MPTYTLTITAKSASGAQSSATQPFVVTSPPVFGASVRLNAGTPGYPGDGQFLNWANAQQLDSYVFGSTSVKWAQRVQKIFANNGSLPTNAYSYWPNLQSYVHTYGGQVLVSLRPHWSTYNSVQDSAFKATVSDLESKIGGSWKCVLYSEANGPKAGPGSTTQEFADAADYHAYWDHYASIFHNISSAPLCYDPMVGSGTANGGSGNESGAIAYCPPSGVDEIFVDYYGSSWKANQRIDSIAAVADNYPGGPLPFGLGEWGMAASVNTPTWSEWNSFVDYLIKVFSSRQQAGLPNSWLIFWAYDGPNNGLGGIDAANSDSTGDGIGSANDLKIPKIVAFRNALS